MFLRTNARQRKTNMNKNTKTIRETVKKNKNKESQMSFTIPKTMPGGQLGNRTHTISTHICPRKSKSPKVAANGGGGPSLLDQNKLFHGHLLKLA